MIHEARIHRMADGQVRRGQYVLYWMQQAQRAEFNHALEYAIEQANALRLPVVVAFALTGFPEANRRHYQFMLEGLRETEQRLAKRGIGFCIRAGPPEQVIPGLAKNAALLVGDAGYLRVQRDWRTAVAARVSCPVVLVESDAIIPVAAVSDHAEFAARTIRPKIHRLLAEYLQPVKPRPVAVSSVGLIKRSLPLANPEALCRRLRCDDRVPAARHQVGGLAAANKLLERFLGHRLADYATESSDPVMDGCSHMSAYLHFGQISALDIAKRVQKSDASRVATEAYLEQLIVRRELGLNACWFNRAYDRYAALPAWARKTLDEHRKDKREFIYARSEWEAGATHDPCWNAAQAEMLITGQMHNYMRMYWGKKLLEWSRTPEEAFETALYLNNKYELDGRDPNGFAGVAWCFGLHDRPWTERPVFGTIRYMNANGLRRKFDIQDYVERWLGPKREELL
ncbi:MAG: deoxyribodipyrimidine photolyase [Lentisphaerae bacterium]|jgi:deoxyribodipyrimidine photo-lyase|nr:deoxyribodipyrimidine photolyase [Lentisphaerota bacterium]HQQ60563.1 deoxyribodipyrimidine photo-lyase [Kiritimatiellia bacterium]